MLFSLLDCRKPGLNIYSNFYSFETSNGISAQEAGQVTNPGAENQGIAVRGSFSYTDAEGHQYTGNNTHSIIRTHRY